ncbi:MAG: cysteine-rich CWC family protein [Brachymonas sp.]|nr:cysteine-rich CWC family protein [Brachymonas sp.]
MAALPDCSTTADAAQRCPLCGQLNQCAQQAGAAPAPCWCMQRPALGRDWLAQHLPSSATQSPPSCLCPACHARLEREKPTPV